MTRCTYEGEGPRGYDIPCPDRATLILTLQPSTWVTGGDHPVCREHGIVEFLAMVGMNGVTLRQMTDGREISLLEAMAAQVDMLAGRS